MGVTAIFGGTFNPPHIGHYEMLEALQKCSDVKKILLIPTRIPPHKVCDCLADDRDRIDMCEALISVFDKAELCLTEFEREGKSYTYDTVKYLQKLKPETKFSFICGGDMLMSFDTWYKYGDLMKLLPFIVFRRADIDSSTEK